MLPISLLGIAMICLNSMLAAHISIDYSKLPYYRITKANGTKSPDIKKTYFDARSIYLDKLSERSSPTSLTDFNEIFEAAEKAQSGNEADDGGKGIADKFQKTYSIHGMEVEPKTLASFYYRNILGGIDAGQRIPTAVSTRNYFDKSINKDIAEIFCNLNLNTTVIPESTSAAVLIAQRYPLLSECEVYSFRGRHMTVSKYNIIRNLSGKQGSIISEQSREDATSKNSEELEKELNGSEEAKKNQTDTAEKADSDADKDTAADVNENTDDSKDMSIHQEQQREDTNRFKVVCVEHRVVPGFSDSLVESIVEEEMTSTIQEAVKKASYITDKDITILPKYDPGKCYADTSRLRKLLLKQVPYFDEIEDAGIDFYRDGKQMGVIHSLKFDAKAIFQRVKHEIGLRLAEFADATKENATIFCITDYFNFMESTPVQLVQIRTMDILRVNENMDGIEVEDGNLVRMSTNFSAKYMGLRNRIQTIKHAKKIAESESYLQFKTLSSEDFASIALQKDALASIWQGLGQDFNSPELGPSTDVLYSKSSELEKEYFVLLKKENDAITNSSLRNSLKNGFEKVLTEAKQTGNIGLAQMEQWYEEHSGNLKTIREFRDKTIELRHKITKEKHRKEMELNKLDQEARAVPEDEKALLEEKKAKALEKNHDRAEQPSSEGGTVENSEPVSSKEEPFGKTLEGGVVNESKEAEEAIKQAIL